MKTKNLFFSILAVLLFPSMGALAQQAPSGASIQVITTFDYPGNHTQTFPLGINDQGDVTGVYYDAKGRGRGFVRFADGSFSVPFIEPNDNGGDTEGRGINDEGTICGYYLSATDGFLHGFFLDAGGFGEFNLAGANDTLVTGLNDSADFVGGFSTFADPIRPFSNIGGITTTIDIPGALDGVAFGINNGEQITGWYTDSAGITRGWWQDSDGTIHAPFDPPRSRQTLPFGISERGLIVGRFATANFHEHGFVYNPVTRGFVTFDYPGAFLTSFYGINRDGFICGRYLNNSGSHGFLAQVVSGQ